MSLFQRCVYIASDGGRVCRPLIIVDNGESKVTESHMKKLSVSIDILLVSLRQKMLVIDTISFEGWGS